MVRSRRSRSKEDALSLLADSGISLSSPPGVNGGAATRINGNDDENEKFTPKRKRNSIAENEKKDGIGNGDVILVEDDGDDVGKAGLENEDDDDEDEDEEDEDEEIDDDAKDFDYVLDSDASNEKLKLKSLLSQKKETLKSKLRTEPSSAAKKQRKTHICNVCEKEFGGKTDLKRHMLIHSNERPHKCSQCGKCYRQAVNLKNHITSAHKMQRQFQCDLCPKAFALKERLRLHMRLHSGDKPYACDLCEKCFARGGQLQQHKITHHKDTTVRKFQCEICKLSFSTAANLRAHQERHDQGLDHFCKICKEHFANDVVLHAHINKVHFKLNQFHCEICKETIKEKDFAAHMQTHSHMKTHVCDVCQAFFAQKSQYNVHMRMHTGERPYQCSICWQTFAHSSVLKLHIRKHTGEKPFQCLLCKTDEVTFSQMAHLKTHMKKIHKVLNPYMCTGCGEFFKVKSELQSHMQKCAKCDMDSDMLNSQQKDQQTLSHLRFHIALLIKKISSEQQLHQLGYEKRLIDNVVVASLKLANRKAYDDLKLSAIERMRLNVQEFLNWIVPEKMMQSFQMEALSIESILDKIVTMYMKKN